jgi:hypothetical protein
MVSYPSPRSSPFREARYLPNGGKNNLLNFLGLTAAAGITRKRDWGIKKQVWINGTNPD